MVDLAALKTELTTDPDTVGYTGDDATDADLLNAIPSSGASAPYMVNEALVETAAARGVIPESELTGATAGEQELIKFYLAGSEFVANTANVRSFFGGVSSFSAATKQALQAITQREGSRGEELFGVGSLVTPSQCADARRL